MGGKNKPNRTKNNAKPSSSARSAELLGSQNLSFFGFGAIKDGGVSFLPGVSTTSTEETDSNIDIDFQLSFKKMNKKDSTTKLKALQEFAELCRKADISCVKLVLPSWCRVYSQLCCESDHRVREAAHISHKEVILKVKKHLAPYLKEIIGPWFASQYDTYAPAASACRASFEAAFSPSKMTQAISFCQNEILQYLQVNLIVHTPQSLSTVKTSTPEELEDKYRRIVSSSLLGYASFFHNVTPESLKNNVDGNKQILSSGKFWKLGQHKDPVIRHGFFNALLSLLEHAPWLISDDTQKVASSVFNHLSEDDPLVLPVLWDTALLSVTALPDCWKHSNVEKQLIPKLFALLRTGGKGHAVNVFPKVLPLLNEIPSEKIGNVNNFLDQLFSAMKAGLIQQSVNRSQSEGRVVANTFVESLQFMVMIHRDEPDIIKTLIHDHLIGTIDSYFSIADFQLTWAPLCHYLSILLRSWYKNRKANESVLEQFWSGLTATYEAALERAVTEENTNIVLSKQISMLITLKDPGNLSLNSTSRRVKFDSDVEEEKSVNYATEAIPAIPEFDAALNDFLRNVTWRYVDRYTSTIFSCYLNAVNDLGRAFGYSCLDVVAEKLNLFELYINGIQKDIPEYVHRQLGLLFLSRLANEGQQRHILHLIATQENLDLISFCTDLLKCNSLVVKNWREEDTFSDIFLKLVDKFVNGDIDEEAGNIIYKYLAPDPLINLSTNVKITLLLIATMNNYSSTDLDIKRICTILEAYGAKQCRDDLFQDLIASIFHSCTINDEKSLSHLLRSALKKFKYAQVSNPDAWTNLASKLCMSMDPNTLVVPQTVSMVAEFIDVALDINLKECCEPEEVQEVIEFIQIFLQPTITMKRCSKTVEKLAMISYEVNGLGEIKYYELKESHDSVNELRFDETETGLAFKDYTNWLHYATGLAELFFSAYPVCAKYIDINKPGRYAVTELKVQGETDPDIIPLELSSEEWDELNENAEISSSVFENGNTSQHNLVIPLRSQVLDLIYDVAMLDSLLHSHPEMEQHLVLSDECDLLMKELADALATGTPDEFEYIYKECRALVKNNSTWYALKGNLSGILRRRFLDIHEPIDNENITDVLNTIFQDGLEGKATNILRLTAMISNSSPLLSTEDWNNVFIQMDKAIKHLSKVSEQEERFILMSGVCTFFVVTQDTCSHILSNGDIPEWTQLWKDLVEKEFWTQIFSLWKGIASEMQPKRSLDVSPDSAQSMFASQIKNPLPVPIHVRRINIAVTAGLSLLSSLSVVETLALAELCSYLLISPLISNQILAFKFLLRLVPELVKEDDRIFQESVVDDPKDEDKAFFSRVRDCEWSQKRFSPPLNIAQTVVSALLSDLKIGDTCTVEPFTDSFTFTHGFLCLWCVIVQMLEEAHVALRFQYVSWLKNNNHFQMFLNSTFNLMPPYIVHYNSSRNSSSLFETYGELSYDKPACSEWVEQRACFAYRMCLQRLPAAVRSWWTEADNVSRNLITKVTTQHVSPLLVAAELRDVQQNFAQMENFSVTVTPAARTVVGSYGVDEIQMIITLPSNHPLGLIELDMKTKTSFSQSQALRLFTFLVHRNGSIRDVLAMWKYDMDKKLEGLEECEICFSILNGPNFELPNKPCSTCRKKFHSACLYKWFHTSYKSSCPHCRNQF